MAKWYDEPIKYTGAIKSFAPAYLLAISK